MVPYLDEPGRPVMNPRDSLPIVVAAAIAVDELNQLKAAGQLAQAMDPNYLVRRLLAREAEYPVVVAAVGSFIDLLQAQGDQATPQPRKQGYGN